MGPINPLAHADADSFLNAVYAHGITGTPDILLHNGSAACNMMDYNHFTGPRWRLRPR